MSLQSFKKDPLTSLHHPTMQTEFKPHQKSLKACEYALKPWSLHRENKLNLCLEPNSHSILPRWAAVTSRVPVFQQCETFCYVWVKAHPWLLLYTLISPPTLFFFPLRSCWLHRPVGKAQRGLHFPSNHHNARRWCSWCGVGNCPKVRPHRHGCRREGGETMRGTTCFFWDLGSGDWLEY